MTFCVTIHNRKALSMPASKIQQISMSAQMTFSVDFYHPCVLLMTQVSVKSLELHVEIISNQQIGLVRIYHTDI